MDILIDGLYFCEDFLTASATTVCGILVYKDCTSSKTKYELSVKLLFCLCGTRQN